MKYFICSDIHGFYSEWMKALNEKKFDIDNPNHKLIICGDLFDRGHEPKKIIDYVLKHKDKIIFIKGNHEDLMQDMIARNKNTVADITNGTTGTIIDLCPEWQITEFDLKKIAKETRLNDVFALCKDYFETEHYIFVHGWIPVIEDCLLYDKDWRTASQKSWIRARWSNPVDMFEYEIFEPNKTIVCGHWHCSALWHKVSPEKYDEFGENANFEPFITKDMMAIDACTAYSHKVNVVVIDD